MMSRSNYRTTEATAKRGGGDWCVFVRGEHQAIINPPSEALV